MAWLRSSGLSAIWATSINDRQTESSLGESLDASVIRTTAAVIVFVVNGSDIAAI
jgi:hypothetical protein